MKRIVIVSILAALQLSQPLSAQDNSNIAGEIIVTATRADGEFLSDEQTVIGLRRNADSAVQSVEITSDSREEDVRKREIHAMLDAAIKRSASAGVELVTGDFELVPLTLANYKDLLFGKGDRPDTSEVSFFVKTKLAGSTGSAQSRIDSFIKAVPTTGRSLIEKKGDLTLTIINPDQYRDEIVKLVAKESLKYAAYFGPDYGVDVVGLNEQLLWEQVSGSEVFLFLPYRFNIRPK